MLEITDRPDQRARLDKLEYKDLWGIEDHRGPVVDLDLPDRKGLPVLPEPEDLKEHLGGQVPRDRMEHKEPAEHPARQGNLAQQANRDQMDKKDRLEISEAQDHRALRDNPAL